MTEPQPTPTAAPLPRPATDAQAPGHPTAEAPSNPTAVSPQPPLELAPGAPPPAPQPAAPPLPHHKIKRTRTSGLWVAVGFFAVILLLLLIFILQNGRTVDVSYMGAHGHLPLGVALLLAAVCGVLLVVLAGAARISQLRTVARRHRRADKKTAQATAAGSPNPPASGVA
jgi:lipopolysaccharide assembly protein A